MNKIKVNTDREKLSSEYIQSKQDFSSIQSQVHAKTSLFKSTWFYGATGLASVALCISFAFTNSNKQLHDSTITQNELKIAQATFLPDVQKIKASSKLNYLAPVFQPSKKSTAEKVHFHEPLAQSSNQVETIKRENEIVKSVSKAVPFENKKLSTPVFTDEDEIGDQKTKKQNSLPCIGGKYNGEIILSELLNKPLTTTSGFVITEFEINYATNRGDKIEKVVGNKIPSEIGDKIKGYGIDQMIFITSIFALDSNGRRVQLTPLNLVVVLD